MPSPDPLVVNRLSVSRMVRTKREELQALAACLKCAGYFRSDANRIKRPNVHDVVIELEASGPAENHVDLFGPRVAVHERRPLSPHQAKVGHASLLGIKGRS